MVDPEEGLPKSEAPALADRRLRRRQRHGQDRQRSVLPERGWQADAHAPKPGAAGPDLFQSAKEVAATALLHPRCKLGLYRVGKGAPAVKLRQTRIGVSEPRPPR